MDTIDEGDWTALNAALQTLAEAHNKRGRRLARVEAEVKTLRALLEEAPASTSSAVQAVQAVQAVLNTGFNPICLRTCAMCGADKEPGRTALTCKDCSGIRTTILREKGDRSIITRSACHSCGGTFKPQTRFLCPTCTRGHKMYIAAQT